MSETHRKNVNGTGALVKRVIAQGVKGIVKCQWHTIAVMEYQSMDDPNLSINEKVEYNTNEYIKIMKTLSGTYNTIIIVFPEGTLDNVRGKEDLKYFKTEIISEDNPCKVHSQNYPKYIRNLSCAARELKVSILVNTVEYRDHSFYTTDVIFNFQGDIQFSIPRERRIGVPEFEHDPIPFAVPVNFVISFFEMMAFVVKKLFLFTPTSFVTGFTFSFEKAIAVNDKRDYLVCSNWISQLPFLTSLQVMQMWAQEYNVSVFFSGANNPTKGQGGSGIYHAKGPVLLDIVVSGGTKAYVYNFSGNGEPGYITSPVEDKDIEALSMELDTFKTEEDTDLTRFEHKLLDTSSSKTRVQLCYDKVAKNHFCCYFYIEIDYEKSLLSETQYFYQLVAYRGSKNYYNIFEPGGIEVCAVIACLTSKLSSCGQRFKDYNQIKWPITFKNIEIKANFSVPKKEKIYFSSQFPNSLLTSLRPIHPNFTKWSKQIIKNASNPHLEITFSLLEAQNRILTFGIFGRNFTLIDPKPKKSKSNRKQNLLHGLIVLVLLSLILK